ncbi:hypothetical protein [Paenibacillus sp. NPDC093718]|uniref:hypothetical protein n=1 Tax=Paenibacillus sp. NPDC093718 TaxID=3390601 RepID=UPI003D029ECE
MYTQAIDFDRLREERLQQEYVQTMHRLQLKYDQAAAVGDTQRMEILAEAMDSL